MTYLGTIAEQNKLLKQRVKRLEKELEKERSKIDVEIIRCEECKHWAEVSAGAGACERFGTWWYGSDATDFCSFAEVKGDGNEL